MARHIEDEVKYYYDSHSTEEDLMGETAFHAALVRYLVDVLIPRSANRRLFGWRLDRNRQTMKEMPIGPSGSLWSPHLQSWLVPDGATLRLYDHTGQMRLTHAEAEAQRADAAFQRAETEARRAQVLAEKLRSLGIDPDQIL